MCKKLWYTIFGYPLPHPREAERTGATMDSVDLSEVVYQWLTKWEVPTESFDFWKGIKYTLSESLPYPAWKVGQDIFVRPEAALPGVLAHESAHISQGLLKEKDFAEFTSKALNSTDPLVKQIMSKSNWGSPDIERHAEIYRFLGQKMPEEFKQYYPNLLKGG